MRLCGRDFKMLLRLTMLKLWQMSTDLMSLRSIGFGIAMPSLLKLTRRLVIMNWRSLLVGKQQKCIPIRRLVPMRLTIVERGGLVESAPTL